ncbi:unnamed protein product [Ectocarpus sp. 6 AP-2014]
MGSVSKQVRPSPGRKSRSSSKHSRRLCCLLVCAVVVSCSCQGSLRVAKECARLAPYFLTADQRAALCGQATTTAPALCARKAHAAPRLSGSHILELCSGAISELPGLCVAGLSQSTARNLSPDLRVELCRGALSDAPALCVEHSVQSKRKPHLVVDVCKGASNVAPAECLDLLPQNLPLEAAVGLCRGAKGVGPAICTNARDQLRNEPDITVRLCRGASGQGPADCFRRSALATALSTDERVELCEGARTDAPARCAGQVRDRRISPPNKVALCRGASGIAPATCLASTPPSLSAEDRVGLCQGAAEESPTAPTACLKTVPQDLPSVSAVALCRGAADKKAAAECAKVARHTVGESSDALMTLCQGASSAAPAHCAKAAFRAGADRHLAAVLCAGSTSLAPASCFAAAPRQIPADVRVETCIGALSTSPALCLAASGPRELRGQPDWEAVCPLDPEAGRRPRRGVDHRLAARVCRDALDDKPALCARAAPLRMSDSDVEVLCAADGQPGGEETADCAAAGLMIGFSGASAASLCRGASSGAPVACAETAVHRIGEAGRLAICKGASSTAPARCANSVSGAGAPSASEVEECREAVPRPSRLHITDLGHEGEPLFPDQPMHATLEVWDQWGAKIHTDSSTVVRASVALRGSNGAVANAHGRFNTSDDGVVHFSHLSFSGSGNLTLQFFVDGNDSKNVGAANVPLAAARVIVEETEHGAILRRCRAVFSRLACPWPVKGEGASGEWVSDVGMGTGAPHQVQPSSSVATEAVSTVSGGAGAAWYVMTCQQVLEENGINVAYVSSPRTEPLSALLWYHPGIETLETGAGLPTRDQPAWERLGVDRDASGRELRRAYYRQSLLWHPDRWVRYAIHSARAQDVFELVGDAYEWMVSSSKALGENN